VRRRISGAVANQVKQKKEPECLVEQADELGGTAAAVAQRAIDRQLERRLEGHSEAARYLESERDVLGEQNLPTLDKQSRAITHASFVSHVRLELYRRELERLLDEKETVKATLERSASEDQAANARGNLSKAKHEQLEARSAANQAARAAFDKEVAEGNSTLDALERRIEALQREYQTVIDGVLAELTAKQKAAPAPNTVSVTDGAEPAHADRNADVAGTAR
jgi:hypothetical protein